MWSAVVSSIFLVTCADFVLSERNGSSVPALNQRLSKFKTDVHRIFQGTRIRVKRQLEGSDPLIRKLKFGKVTQVDLPYLSDLSLSFWLSIESRNQVLIGTIEGSLMLFETFDDEKNAIVVASSDYGGTPIKARAFSYYEEQWFVVLHNLEKFRIQLYKLEGRGLQKSQSIDLYGFSDIELVELKGNYYLVVSTYSTETSQGYSYQASLKLYDWKETQFDEIASRVTYGARSLDCWTSDGSLYIAVGQEVNDEGNLAVGSPVYLYNNKEEDKLVLWEIVATYGPTKVKHFYSAENRYLIFIGKQDAVIYWWSNDQFLEWQNLQKTANALDVSVLSLGDEVAIVVVLKEEALIYTLDTSGYYVISFSMSFKGSSLQSLQFMFNRNYYYALALLNEPQARSTWKLELSHHFLPSVDSLDILQECLLDTEQKVAERQSELDAVKSDIMRVWRRGSSQTLKTKIVVQGRIWSNESKVKDVIILNVVNIPHFSFSLVMEHVMELTDSAESAKREFDGVVSKSLRQIIRGIKHFADHVYVPSLRIESTSNDISINDVRISRLKHYALRKMGNQVVPYTTVVSNVFTGTVNVDVINGISTQDLLLLHGKQFVTGILEFSGASANTMSVKTINSIPIEDIVTTTSSQVIKDLKTFSRLASRSVNVQGATNEVHLGSMYKKIATIDNYNEFLGHLTFQNPWTVIGNISLTSKLNKVIDISKLASQSVNRDSQQDLTGIFTFNSGQTIDGDIFVTDSINGVSTDNLLTIDSNQMIFADVVFNSSLSVARDVIVDTINNVNVGQQAVQKLPPHQFISGRKIFDADISTDYVDMTEYVTLDDVDPSSLVQDIVQHRQGVVNSSFMVFTDVEVLGDMTVTNGFSDYIAELLSSVWLKSIEQNISGPVTANNLYLKHDLQVHNINNFDLDNDFVTSYTDDVIESSKSFHSEILVKSITAENARINGVNLKSLKTEIDHSTDEGIKGIKTINHLEIFGNLNVMKLNELKTEDIMRPNDHQVVFGPVEFVEGTALITGNAESEHISFDFINGLDLQDYFKTAVELTDSPLFMNNKHFKYLKATNLSVPFESTIAGVNLQDMVQRVVTLNAPQLITAPKSFAPEVHFSKVTTSSLNGLQLENYLNKVVFTDEISKISHKQFVENVQASNVFVRGTVNDINLEDLASNVFYKSEDNEVSGHFTFIGDMDIGYLSSSVIDGVRWEDLILIQNDQELEAAWFLSNIHADKDIFITGLLNGCDLSRVSSSIYTNKTTQVVNKRINVNTISIVGNLEVKERINEIQLEVLQNFITVSDDQVLTSNVVVDGLVVDNLILENLVESQNIEFIVTDAVRHSLPQEIKGYKEFKENVNVHSLNGGDLFVSRLDGVDLEELKETSVLNTGHQEIEGEKIFPSLFINNAIISGFLNGLKLPQDVVRTDGSDHITSPTYFVSDVYVTDKLVVHGLIDGVDVNELIQQRVTLNADQNITAQLILHDDTTVHGELTVEGTINDIVLELVAKVKSVHPLQGYKVFLDFYVSGSLSASSVNGHNVPQLDANILRHNKDDYINEIQTFQQPIQAQNSLHAEWINGISVKWLKGAFAWMINNVKPALEYLQSLRSSLQQQLVHQLSTTQGRESKFAYFILHQEITSPATRILRSHPVHDKFRKVQIPHCSKLTSSTSKKVLGTSYCGRSVKGKFTLLHSKLKKYPNKFFEYYRMSISSFETLSNVEGAITKRDTVMRDCISVEEKLTVTLRDDGFSHSLVMWIKQKHCVLMEMCCHLEFSYWLRVNKNGIVMVDDAAESGKYYPILDSSQNVLNKEFFVWTNSTYGEPQLCGHKSNELFIATYSNNLMEKFIGLENTPQLSDVKSFRKGHLYAVAAFYFDTILEEYGSTTVYAYDEAGAWYEHQVLQSFGVLSLDITSYSRDFREDILLAAGTGMDTVPVSFSTVYKWNNSNRRFEILQNIPSRYVASTLWIKMRRDLLLALANVDVWPVKEAECSELVSGGQINIYLYKDKLEWIQSIPVGGVVSMVSFSLDGDTYLAAASSHQQTVYIFEWRGYSGFVQIQSISTDVQHLNIYKIDDDIYLTVASASSSSKILKMVKKGKRSSTRYFEKMPLEQKDEAPESSRIVTGC